jgi:hypothetical protein
MERVLIILPTKDRLEYICTCMEALVGQAGAWDLFVADMNTDGGALRNSWLFSRILDRLYLRGHSWLVTRIEGNNTMDGAQTALEFAHDKGHELAVLTDDDIVLDSGWIATLQRDHAEHPDASSIVGMTLLPWMSEQEQMAPHSLLVSRDYAGEANERFPYWHCTLIPPWKDVRGYEQVYGAFMFKVEHFYEVGGFPLFLSPAGCRGEQWPMQACRGRGRTLEVDPTVKSWHYSAPTGGLRWMGPDRKAEYQKADFELFWRWMAKRPTRVERP